MSCDPTSYEGLSAWSEGVRADNAESIISKIKVLVDLMEEEGWAWEYAVQRFRGVLDG